MHNHTLSARCRIFLTGASRGIGRETALQLARLGHRVILVARDADALGEVAAEIAAIGGQAEVLPLDVTDPDAVQRGVAEVLARGPCDVLINNAGSCEQGEWRLQPLAALRDEMALNFWGPVHTTRALLPAFIARGEGVIVNVSSLLGSVPAPTTVNYCAAKAALEQWSHALSTEVERFGVRVSVYVAPHTDTALGRRTEWRGVKSLPVAYAAAQLVTAVDRAPRKRGAGPVYAMFLWMARHFPRFMERVVGDGTRHLLSAPREAPASLAS